MKENLRADVVVLGSGIAGFSVAETLAGAGKSVILLSPVHSPAGTATALSSGTWDTGPVHALQARDRVTFRDFVKSASWRQSAGSLLMPEGMLTGDDVPFDRFHGDSGVFSSLMQGHDDGPALLPMEGGRFRATYAAQKICYAANAMAWAGKKVGVAVCPQWRLPTELWIPEWKRRLQELSIPAGDLVPFKISLKGFDWPLSQLAARLESDPNVAQLFREQIGRGLKESPVDLLLFPPLFLDAAFVRSLETDFKTTVAEMVSPSEPTAGLRLARTLQAKREQLGIERIPIVSARQPSLRQNTFLVTSATGELLEVKSRAVVLCTGKFLSGGLESTGRVSESVLGLPLFLNRTRGPIVYQDELKEPAELFRLGLWLDEWHRPRGIDGTLAENLFASGSLVGGLDFSQGRFGLGFFTWLGRACGKKIHEWLG